MEDEKIITFWKLYDSYIGSYSTPTPAIALRRDLSSLLAEIEKPNRVTQLAYHKNESLGILAWQVLRDQPFFDGKSGQPIEHLCAGELLGWDDHFDRDIFISRNPWKEVVSGYILNPGITAIDDNKDPYNDQRGLYLPIYHPEVYVKIYDYEILRYRPNAIQHLEEVKRVPSNIMAMYR